MKFKYGDRVKVLKGFHRGFTGLIVNTQKLLFFEREYIIRFDYRCINSAYEKESNLELERL